MKWVLLIILWLWQLSTYAQQGTRVGRFIHRYLNDTAAPGKPQFLAYPTIGYAPETGFELGIISVLVFTAHNDYEHSRLSEITTLLFGTQRNQYGIWNDHAIYTFNDNWFFLGRHRWQNFPLYYWGVGPNTNSNNDLVIDGRYLLLRERIMHRLAPNLFFGPEIDYQNLYKSTFDGEDLARHEERGLTPPRGLNGSSNLGLGAALVYDTRHNYLNVRRGDFLELSLLRNAAGFGSDYQFTTSVIDARLFRKPFAEKQTLAWQFYGQFTLAGEPPFNQYALLGNEMMLRGYYMGRFRDRQYLSTQVEYRWLPLPFSKRIGFAAFAAAGQVSGAIKDVELNNLKWSIGGGPRYLLLPRKDIFIRLDVGFTREGPGYYLFLGEAF